MLTLKSILSPVDFSASSAKAYGYAQSLADHYHASVSLLHVIHPRAGEYVQVNANNLITRDLEDFAVTDIKQFAQEHTRGEVKPDVYARVGPVRETILEFAAKKSADLIVMATHSHSEGAHGMLGSVAEYVLRHASCPVLAVRNPQREVISPDGKGRNAVRIRKILFCTDLSPRSERALPYALSLAAQYAAELTLLHVIEAPAGSRDIEKETGRVKKEMERPISQSAYGSCTIRPLVRLGKAYEQIVKYEAESEADLVVMGIHGRNVVDLALAGSTTHRVLHLGACPVITVPVDRLAGEVAERRDRVA
jgi:nucleotide-binding universal stress UspA family protein